MPRDDGFAIMDVSTSICDDSKFRRLQRENPEHVAVGFTAYVATMADSWKAAKRVPIDDAWPAFLPFDGAVCDSLKRVGLLDSKGRVSPIAWRAWFEPARERRAKSRDRWTRYNAKRDADTTVVPRGSDADTATSVPSVRPSDPSGSSVPSPRATREKKNGLKTPQTREEALLALSDEFLAGHLTELEYSRQRKALGAA